MPYLTELDAAPASDSENDNSSQYDSDPDKEGGLFDEESVITYYFRCGEYEEIIQFLTERHNHTISKSTLLRRLKQYGLCRQNKSIPDIRDHIKVPLNGPSLSGGYRRIWRSLQLEGIYVPRAIVQRVLSELDPVALKTS